MKILALDTATERCSAALLVDGLVIERSVETPRGHAELILPMIEEVLAEGQASLGSLDGLAYGRGPGAFTGVRIAVGVVQGLAYGADLPTIGVSDLAAVAQQVAQPGEHVLVCMDARMGEVYWAEFRRASGEALVRPAGAERVDKPEAVHTTDATLFAGTGFKAYARLAELSGGAHIADVLPRAREIAALGAAALQAGQGIPARDAAPVYLRDQVVRPPNGGRPAG